MNRSVIVSLLKKSIDELILLTEGFSEMTHYPEAILHLAKNKTTDIAAYIDMLRETEEPAAAVVAESPQVIAEEPVITEEPEEIKVEELPETPEEEITPAVDEVIENDVEVVEDVEEVIHEEEDELEEEEEVEEAEEEIEDEAEEIEEDEKEEDVIKEEVKEVIEEEIKPEIIETPKITTLADKLTPNSISRNDMHARPEMNGIQASIANKKVDDIRQAISLGDRFRFQRELFRNNGEDMNKTLSYINQLATYEEVVSFLRSKYIWPEENEAASDFLQLVKRKF